MEEATAFAPGHITGFFQPHEAPDPLRTGSTGAGVCISGGVTTRVKAKTSKNPRITTRIDGLQAEAPVTDSVISQMLPKNNDLELRIDHTLKIPMGAGLGSSGAGALSLALALNEALSLGYSRTEAAQQAHTAEVICRTGLGTVMAEYTGGLVIREEAGAPGMGKISKVKTEKSLVVSSVTFGSIPTRSVLDIPEHRKRIEIAGASLLSKIRAHPSPQNFMKLSRNFAENIGLMTDRVRTTLKTWDSYGVTGSMHIFGEGAFVILPVDQIAALTSGNRKAPTLFKIEERGARVL